jgi:hypothetical protein
VIKAPNYPINNIGTEHKLEAWREEGREIPFLIRPRIQ